MTEPKADTIVIELPHLDAHQALRLVAVFERICTAIWRAHGRQMSELLIDASDRREYAAHDLLTSHFEDSDLPF